jgi:probable rRNA maturation factor
LTIRLHAIPPIKPSGLRDYVRHIKHALQLKGQNFNLCFVDDRTIRGLNATYRGKPQPTDVLSFPWRGDGEARTSTVKPHSGAAVGASRFDFTNAEFEGFLGDIVISVPAARRNAGAEGHSTATEIRLLILHGVLHLLGYDHARDRGEMTAKELALRRELGIVGKRGREARSRLRTRPKGSNGIGRQTISGAVLGTPL